MNNCLQTKKFLKDWGVEQRLSSSYFPHSNQRAELGVKSAKRMLRENVSPSGHLNTDKFLRALLTHRNTPHRDTELSLAQVIFGHPIQDFIPVKIRMDGSGRVSVRNRIFLKKIVPFNSITRTGYSMHP